MPSTSGRDSEILLVQGSAVPSVNEFLQHPDFRQIAAFFLGWVFICSLLSIASSPTANSLARWLTSHVSARLSSAFSNSAGTSTAASCAEKRPLDLLSLHNHDSNLHSREDHFLTLMLFVCFAFAGLANFSSLLTFDAGSGSSVCAFVVAWGGISACCGRLFGLVALCIELHKLHVTKFEIYAMVVLLFAAVALVFAEYAVSIGTTEFLPQLGIYLCYRVRYLPTSLTTSLVYMTLEVYILLRLMWFIAPGFLSLRHRLAAIGDARALRTASLILLELLTVIPRIKFVGIVAEFIPFAIGSLCVLGAFNKPIRCRATLDDGASFHSISISNLTPHFRSYKSPSTSIHPHISNHPFAMGRFTPSTIQIGPSALWPHTTGNSQGSTATSTTAMSAETAMAHVASRLGPAFPRYTPPHDHSYAAVEH
ncbi:hypothetical protein PAXINDRAFT_96331 [Paxillus involutus ATCC 200175]|nr:hypothetical protein PAXINDRAFT_96331 [Paxillus involutus ATCC 200175]